MTDTERATKLQGFSIHGSDAAKRQATSELLFFAHVGDLERCQRIVTLWNITLHDEECRDYDHRTPLHLAAAHGCYSVAKWLLTERCSVNSVDYFGRTPLEEAVRAGHNDVAELLINHGAKIRNKEKQLTSLEDSHLSLSSRTLGEFQPDWEIDRKDIYFEEKVGEGEFGVVHKAVWHGTHVAVKVLKNSTSVAIQDFKTELSMLRQCHHPHTVQFLGAVTREPPFMIVTEFMNGGSLADVFKSPSLITMRRAIEIAMDCARGMAFLHNSKNSVCFIHRDLKPANLMFGGHKIHSDKHKALMIKETGRVKIADFGLSRSISTRLHRRHAQQEMTNVIKRSPSLEDKIPEHQAVVTVDEGYVMTGETGSYRYMAPEVYRHERYNEKVDVYAFGMIFYELLEGIPPFIGTDPITAARQASLEHYRPSWNYKNDRGERVPESMRTLVNACWDPSPAKRPGFLDIVEQIREFLDESSCEKRSRKSFPSFSLIRRRKP